MCVFTWFWWVKEQTSWCRNRIWCLKPSPSLFACIDLIELLSLIRTPFAEKKDYCHSTKSGTLVKFWQVLMQSNKIFWKIVQSSIEFALQLNSLPKIQEHYCTSSIGIHGPNSVPTQNNLDQIINLFWKITHIYIPKVINFFPISFSPLVNHIVSSFDCTFHPSKNHVSSLCVMNWW
jgi:hypothetical protein